MTDNISFDTTLGEIRGNLALRAGVGAAAEDLVRMADMAAAQNVRAVSVDADAVAVIWGWLEKTNIDIYARIFADDADARSISAKVSAGLRRGATGVQLFAQKSDLSALVSAILPIASDLFFNKKLIIGLDLDEVDYNDWDDVFFEASKIGAEGIALAVSGDIVGKFFGFLGALPEDSKLAVHLFIDNDDRLKIEQAARLIQKMRPELEERVIVFVEE